jgi:hypothetical protein
MHYFKNTECFYVLGIFSGYTENALLSCSLFRELYCGGSLTDTALGSVEYLTAKLLRDRRKKGCWTAGRCHQSTYVHTENIFIPRTWPLNSFFPETRFFGKFGKLKTTFAFLSLCFLIFYRVPQLFLENFTPI